MFRVGQKVVCIDASNGGPWLYHVTPLVEGQVYTVSRDTFLNNYGNEAIELAGMDNMPVGYRASRFRPIVSRPTSIEFAHEILRKATRTDEVSV